MIYNCFWAKPGLVKNMKDCNTFPQTCHHLTDKHRMWSHYWVITHMLRVGRTWPGDFGGTTIQTPLVNANVDEARFTSTRGAPFKAPSAHAGITGHGHFFQPGMAQTCADVGVGQQKDAKYRTEVEVEVIHFTAPVLYYLTMAMMFLCVSWLQASWFATWDPGPTTSSVREPWTTTKSAWSTLWSLLCAWTPFMAEHPPWISENVGLRDHLS